jgi:hypothetical protein
LGNKADPRVESDRDGSRGIGSTGQYEDTGRTDTTGHSTSGNTTVGSHTSDSRNTTDTHDTTGRKPSLMEKLNPMVDADGDGKAGFMK